MHCRLLKISSIYRGFSKVLKTIELASMENQWKINAQKLYSGDFALHPSFSGERGLLVTFFFLHILSYLLLQSFRYPFFIRKPQSVWLAIFFQRQLNIDTSLVNLKYNHLCDIYQFQLSVMTFSCDHIHTYLIKILWFFKKSGLLCRP